MSNLLANLPYPQALYFIIPNPELNIIKTLSNIEIYTTTPP